MNPKLRSIDNHLTIEALKFSCYTIIMVMIFLLTWHKKLLTLYCDWYLHYPSMQIARDLQCYFAKVGVTPLKLEHCGICFKFDPVNSFPGQFWRLACW